MGRVGQGFITANCFSCIGLYRALHLDLEAVRLLSGCNTVAQRASRPKILQAEL